MANLHAQPTHRKNTSNVLLPSLNLPVLSRGALSPIPGKRPTDTAAGGGVSHGCTLRGRERTDIHEPQLESASSDGSGGFLRSLLGSRFSVGNESMSLGIPAFLRASFGVNDESMSEVM